nr:site-specific integrase [Priestia megaterium]
MASFTKRGKTWQYTISRIVNGKSKPIRKGGYRTKKEAQVAASEIESELRKGVVPHLKLEPFDRYFEEWLNLYKTNISNNTLERYKNTLQTVKDYFGDKPIQQITKRSYQSFLNEYADGHAKSTVRKLNTHIRACVRDAIDEGIIRTDFTRNVIFSGQESKRSDQKHLNYQESLKLLNEIYKRLNKSLGYYLLLLGLTSGMRFGEIVGLTRKDFDFDNNEITISKTWGYTKKMEEGFGKTKNENSNRVIKMDERTMVAFNNLFDSMPDNIHRLVFFSPQSKYKVISNNAANKLLNTVLDDLDIESITVHGLRHTHASVLIYQKISIYYVSERLGHSDIDTTMNHYAHLLKELREQDEKNTINIFDNMVV